MVVLYVLFLIMLLMVEKQLSSNHQQRNLRLESHFVAILFVHVQAELLKVQLQLSLNHQ